MSLNIKSKPLLASSLSFASDITPIIQGLYSQGDSQSLHIAEAFTAQQETLNSLQKLLQTVSPTITDFSVTDPQTGKQVVWAGGRTVNGINYSGLWTDQFYEGGDGPDTATIFANQNGKIVIGKNGSVSVQAGDSSEVAWLGFQTDSTKAITGAINNGAGLIRLTVVAHGATTGDSATVDSVGGVPNSAGYWPVTVVDPNTVDLAGSVFAGVYTSGGNFTNTARPNPALAVTGAVNNGSGAIRLTVVAHQYTSGDTVIVAGVGGVPNANRYWNKGITVVTADTFDLIGSTFAGAYTSGGTSQRYYGGGLFQTAAIGGASFAGANLRAQANGDLSLFNASLKIVSGNNLITINAGGIKELNTLTNESVLLLDGTILIAEPQPGRRILINKTSITVLTATGVSAAFIGTDVPNQGILRMSSGGIETVNLSSAGGTLRLSDSLGASTLTLSGSGGTVDALAYSAAGFAGIDKTVTSINGTITTQAITYVTSVNFATSTTTSQTTTVVTIVPTTTNTFHKGLITA